MEISWDVGCIIWGENYSYYYWKQHKNILIAIRIYQIKCSFFSLTNDMHQILEGRVRTPIIEFLLLMMVLVTIGTQ